LISTFEKRIQLSVELYPCQLLFIHRDAEKEAHATRVDEIRTALSKVNPHFPPSVCVVPVRMTEAWLLFDMLALRKAASNPNGTAVLQLPDIRRLEREPDPKKILHDLLRSASELSPRRLKKFSVSDCTYRVAELIDDFSPLRTLSAFAALETEMKATIAAQGWPSA
jgi:hypothetical protein